MKQLAAENPLGTDVVLEHDVQLAGQRLDGLEIVARRDKVNQ